MSAVIVIMQIFQQKSWNNCFKCLFQLLGIVFIVPSAYAVCTISSSDPTPPGAWDAHMQEIANMGRLQEVGFQIGEQKIFRIRKRDDRFTPDRLLERLRIMKPRIENLQGHFETPPDRAVLLIESDLDLLGETLAFTSCAAKDEKHDISNFGAEDGDLAVRLPKGLCIVVVRPHMIEGERINRFVLAHE
ncbi:hypothetical protein [Pleionea sediminis]|uniref:hypothetical protein n=1 Tax=Pleionea sediminis TaxID=2569479 RepID=UPI001FE87DF8|nr:hypothetical protein [Pleionea sediminis]